MPLLFYALSDKTLPNVVSELKGNIWKTFVFAVETACQVTKERICKRLLASLFFFFFLRADYKFKDFDTLSHFAVSSLMYLSLDEFADYLPCFLISLSVVSEFITADTPSDLKE